MNPIINYLVSVAIALLLCGQARAREAAAMKTGITEVNGTKLYYEVNGRGHPLVLISGGGSIDRPEDFNRAVLNFLLVRR